MDQNSSYAQDGRPQGVLAEAAPISKLIFSLAKQMRRVFEQQARLQDMTLPQWRALGQLVESNGLSQAALASLIETDPMTTSKILRLLEARGLIERLPDPADSRAKIVRATPQVAGMVETMTAVAGALHRTMLAGISEAEQTAFVRTLNAISENLAGQSDRVKDADR